MTDELLLTLEERKPAWRNDYFHIDELLELQIAKAKQHYEQKLQRMALNYNTIIEETKKQERERIDKELLHIETLHENYMPNTSGDYHFRKSTLSFIRELRQALKERGYKNNERDR